MPEFSHPSYSSLCRTCLKLAGFFDKNTEEGRRGLRELYRAATFYFMPSRAEATAIVYCEANSFGVPCLASRTGGTPSLIEDGVNGWCFPLDARVRIMQTASFQ